MEIGKKIIKVIIVILEGCVVRLKEIQIQLDGNDGIRRVKPIHSDFSTTENINKNANKRKDLYNLSLLDDFSKSIGLPIGSNFFKIIKQMETITEKNLITTIIDAIPNVENLNAIYTALNDPSQIEFTYIAPSPIRKEETMVVHRNFIDEEMKELGLTYDGNSLYDNSLRVIEARQKKVVIDFIHRFENAIIKVLESVDDAERQKRIAVLQKDLEDRIYILDIRLKR